MNENGKVKTVPVFIITSEDSEDVLLQAYNLGAVDIIRKPFLPSFTRCRIDNIIELYMHRNNMMVIIDKQLERINHQNRMLVETLATVVEFRDCESGEHVKRMSNLTRILMKAVGDIYPEYRVSDEEIEKIAMASILHDVGKISIPDSILNKPGRLTKDEFEVMKQHTTKGSDLLRDMPEGVLDEDIYKYSYDICRHHHERWDGRGYPDGLKGDEISIWSQVVSVADVYDALTSPRVYKAAFEHDKAVDMIMNGECGTFNPKILEAFLSSLELIRKR
jgi:putative two-component system response regulator